MEFEITILGSNSASPGHGRNQTSQFISWGNSAFLVDCGESTQHQLRRFNIRYSKIDHIFISHLHGDHYLGLMGLISTFHLNNRKRPLTIFGPRGLDEIITIQLKYGGTVLKYPLHFFETQQDGKNLLLDLPQLKVFSFPLNHRIPCTGFYFEEKERPRKLIKEKITSGNLSVEAIRCLVQGNNYLDENGKLKYSVNEYCYQPLPTRKYAFCSDTVFDPGIINYINHVDVLYHESTFMEAEKHRAIETFHSTAKEAATIAKIAKAKQLLLGHYSTRYMDLDPLLLEAREIFPNSFLSEEGKTYPIR